MKKGLALNMALCLWQKISRAFEIYEKKLLNLHPHIFSIECVRFGQVGPSFPVQVTSRSLRTSSYQLH
jgi:hypothetical protein